MSRRANPLDKYLVRTILIIDSDDKIANRIAGLLSRLGGKAGTYEKSATVPNLNEANAHLANRIPDVIIIDPSVDSVRNVVAFVRRHRKRVVWVIHAHDSWWEEHEEELPRPRQGDLRTYYRLSKDLTGDRARSELVATLIKCHHDYVLRLLQASAQDILLRREGGLTSAQLRKFLKKLRDAIIPLSQLADPPRKKKTAFVSFRFSAITTNRYIARIKPLLEEQGYIPVMMDAKFEKKPIPTSIREHIAECSLFVADLTGLRPDVLLECGAAWIKDTPMILMANRKRCPPAALPFLLKPEKVAFYSGNDQLQNKLREALRKTRRRYSAI